MDMNCGQLKKEENKIQASEIDFLRTVKRCSRLDHMRNEAVRDDLLRVFDDLNGKLKIASNSGRNT